MKEEQQKRHLKRNNPRVLARDEYKKLEIFYKKEKIKVKLYLKVDQGILQKRPSDLTPLQTGKYITSRFPGEFVYRGTQIGEIPRLEKELLLAKTLSDKQIYEKLVEEELINPFGGKKIDYRNVTQLMKELEKKVNKHNEKSLSQYTPQEEN